MNLCLIAPKISSDVGGNENYFFNIMKYCSNFININVATSNIESIFKGKFIDKYSFRQIRIEKFFNNIEVIRASIPNNFIIRIIFLFNDFLNKYLEIIGDKYINPNFYNRKTKINNKSNSVISQFLKKLFIFQRIFSNPNFFQIYYILKKIHRRKKISLIHISPIYFNLSIFAYIFAKKNNIPLIIKPIYHINPYRNSIFYPSYQFIIENSDLIIAETEVEKDFYLKYDISKEKVKVISPVINPSEYLTPKVKIFRKKHNLEEDSPLILFLGRRTYEKGFSQIIYALKILIKKFTDIKLIIAGKKTRAYKDFFNKLSDNLKSHIIDLGFVDEQTKVDAISSCDIFVLPSLDDAFGLVYLEAWLYKKPVIGAKEGNVAGVIDNGENGFLVNFLDIKELAEKIEKLLMNENLKNKMGNSGYKKLIKQYLQKDFNENMSNLYTRFQ